MNQATLMAAVTVALGVLAAQVIAGMVPNFPRF